MQTLEEAQEESGWKLVHGDVFRAPETSPMLFSVLAGTGVQIFAMTIVAMVFAILGFLSPANRGGLLTAILLLFVFMGSFAGYYAARLYKLFGGKEWKKNTILTATLFPAVCAFVFVILDSLLYYEGASTAVPFGTLCALILLWFGISLPLVLVGSYFGFKKEVFEVPVRTNQIARHVPEQMWYTHPLFAIALGGILPFGAVCIELFFIMSALWLHQVSALSSLSCYPSILPSLCRYIYITPQPVSTPVCVTPPLKCLCLIYRIHLPSPYIIHVC